MELKITTLIENMQDDRGELICEHGLSLFIECDGKKILFDTGQTGDFIDNAKKLGVDLSATDAVIISHGHYDHTGGLKRLLPLLKEGTPIYLGEGFFDRKYKITSEGDYRYIGTTFVEKDLQDYNVDLRLVSEDITALTEHCVIYKNYQKKNDFEKLNTHFVKNIEETPIVDSFGDELSLGIQTTKGLVVIVGCSHFGIANMLVTIQERTGNTIFSVLGGTHLVAANEERMEKTIQVFKELNIQQIATSHCTGEAGMEKLQQTFREQYIKNNTGHIYEVE